MFRIVICPSFVNLANSTPISSEISTVFSFSVRRSSVLTSRADANFFRVLNPISPFVPFSYLEMSARSISTASLSCFCDQPFPVCTFLYFDPGCTPRYEYQPRLHLLSNPTDFSGSFMTCVLMNSGYQIAHSYSRTLAVPESLTE